MRVVPLFGEANPAAVAALTGLDDLESVDVRVAPRVMRRLWRGPVHAMTLRNRVYVASEALAGDGGRLTRLLVHELVHVRQWRAAGRVRFLLRYLGDYLRGRLTGQTHDQAYRNIRYEVEARRIAGF